MPRSVQVSGNPTPIKDVVIKDGSGKCKLTLWRDLAEAEVTTGSWIKATNIQTKTYNSDTYFSSTSRTAIMVYVFSLKLLNNQLFQRSAFFDSSKFKVGKIRKCKLTITRH